MPGSFFPAARGSSGAGVCGGLWKGSCLTPTGGEESRRSRAEARGDTTSFLTAAGGESGVRFRGGLWNGSCFTVQGGEESRRSIDGGTVLGEASPYDTADGGVCFAWDSGVAAAAGAASAWPAVPWDGQVGTVWPLEAAPRAELLAACVKHGLEAPWGRALAAAGVHEEKPREGSDSGVENSLAAALVRNSGLVLLEDSSSLTSLGSYFSLMCSSRLESWSSMVVLASKVFMISDGSARNSWERAGNLGLFLMLYLL